MASRTAFPGTIVDLVTQLGTVNNNGLPGGWIGLVSTTSATSGITTETNVGLSVAVTVNTSRYILIACFVPSVIAGSVANDIASVFIKESSTYLQSVRVSSPGAGSANSGAFLWCIIAPSAGAHTYTVRMEQTSGSGSATFGVGSGTSGAQLLVVDLGAQ